MKKTVATTIGLVLAAISLPAQAQTARDDIEVMLELAQLERKAVVAQNMELTPEESEAFWPVYNEYAQKLRTLNARDAELILEYAEAYESLTDEKAGKLLSEAQLVDQRRVKARIEYTKKLTGTLPVKKVARAYQIETKLDAVREFELARAIPLAR